MENSKHCNMFFLIQLADQFHYFDLMMEIQRGSGLIQKNNLRLLGNGSCQNYTLPLTAAQLIVKPVSEHIRLGQFHGTLCNFPVFLALTMAKINVWISSHHHNVFHCKIIVHVIGLRNHSYHPGTFFRL